MPPLPPAAPRTGEDAAPRAHRPVVGTDAGGAAVVEDLLAPRTLQARFDLDDDELAAVCAALTAVTVGPLRLPRYRLREVAALLRVGS